MLLAFPYRSNLEELNVKHDRFLTQLNSSRHPTKQHRNLSTSINKLHIGPFNQTPGRSYIVNPSKPPGKPATLKVISEKFTDIIPISTSTTSTELPSIFGENNMTNFTTKRKL